MGNGNFSTIKLKEGDDPLTVAEIFCESRKLPTTVVDALCEHLVQNLEDAQVAVHKQANNQKSTLKRELQANVSLSSNQYTQNQVSLTPQIIDKHQKYISKQGALHSNSGGKFESPISSPYQLKASSQNSSHMNTNDLVIALSEGTFSNNSMNNNKLNSSASHERQMQDGERKHIQKIMYLRRKLKKRQQYYRMKLAASLKKAGQGSANTIKTQKDVAQRLQRYGLSVRERQEILRQKIIQQELEMCKIARASKGSKKLLRIQQVDPLGKGSAYDKLYVEYQRRQTKLQAQREKCLTLRDQEEMREFTGHPRINKSRLSRSQSLQDLQQKQNLQQEREEIWQKLQKRNKNTDQKVDTLRKVKDQIEMKECTFQPKISFVTKSMMEKRGEDIRNRQTQANRFLRMYKQAQVYKENLDSLREKDREKFSFSPTVNKGQGVSPISPSKLLSTQNTVVDLDLEETDPKTQARSQRLYDTMKKKQEKQKQTEKLIKDGYDPFTGEQMFSPKLIKHSPSSPRDFNTKKFPEALNELSSKEPNRFLGHIQILSRPKLKQKCILIQVNLLI